MPKKSPLSLLKDLMNVRTAKEAEDALRSHSPHGMKFVGGMDKNVADTIVTGDEHAMMTAGPYNIFSRGTRDQVEFKDPHLIDVLPGSGVKIAQHTHPDGSSMPSKADIDIHHSGSFGSFGNKGQRPRADFIHGPNSESALMMITDAAKARGAMSYYDLPEVARQAERMIMDPGVTPFKNLHASPEALDIVRSGRAYNPTGNPEDWYRDLLSEALTPYLTQSAVKRGGAGNVVFDMPNEKPLIRFSTPSWVIPQKDTQEPAITAPGKGHEILDYLNKTFQRHTGMKDGGLARMREYYGE